ncbi:MAG: hypothetical protein HY673_15610 [Chloroflexi bacterium]|nr:hypothetical protein [Chloroflexota bacterium]
MYKNEAELYPHVMTWLNDALKGKYPGYSRKVVNTSRTKLQILIEREGLQDSFPMFPTYEIMVDISAILRRSGAAFLGLVECKLKPITLKDIGQLWGYATVAKPKFAMLISPGGTSDAVNTLLHIHQLYDLLDYAPGKRIAVASWDPKRREVIPKSVIPPRGIF